MNKVITNTTGGRISPFGWIKRTNDPGMEFWSSRDSAELLGYGDYRNFEGVIEKAKLACFNSGHRLEDHFVDVTEMVEIAKATWQAAEKPRGARIDPNCLPEQSEGSASSTHENTADASLRSA